MTPALHRLGLGLALALASPAVAQTKTEEAATPKAAPAGGFSPLGDPSRFTRMGGWGGMGAGMAQFGLAKAMMINMPAVQKELKLTEDQAKAIREWSDGLRKRGESMFRRQAEAGNAADANKPDRPQGPPQQGGPPNLLGMLETITTITREGESGLAKILDKKQRARLTQIALQMEGVSALARPEVAEAIYLMPEQVEQIQEILAEAKTRQIGHFLTQGFAMRGRRDAPQPRPDQAKADTSKADPKADDPETQAKRRQADRERMRTEFTKFRDGSDQIQDAATMKILRVLAKKQRERFDKLLGEPFDPAKLNGPGGFGGPGAPPTADAKPADVPKPSDPAPTRSSRLRDARFKGDSKQP
jgi:hypothetical protein